MDIVQNCFYCMTLPAMMLYDSDRHDKYFYDIYTFFPQLQLFHFSNSKKLYIFFFSFYLFHNYMGYSWTMMLGVRHAKNP